ncbi:DUF4382 domain-containing protein [Flavivirga eckloniae]|uniref:DUF4382 domain-containing protein n=1 Tax=Flavivirga eckloniae TaxID=1803846 RepID=A0A2K9PRE4_9FLAO|nr:DUF4382 domain-containing protein [Flavivirga eckloniae]AUP79643.1 hypothetical protein C1H87_13370 [Flavivirga eckloniae]
MKTLTKLKSILLVSLVVSFFGCKNFETNNVGAQVPPTISIKLADESGNFEAENVGIFDVMIKMDEENEWLSLNSKQKGESLSGITGDFNELLVNEFPIKSGTLEQIKLVLGDAKGQDLKLELDAAIEAGYAYDFVLDFNIEPVSVTGKIGGISLRSEMRVATDASSGIIEGSVSPPDEPTIVSVVDTKETPETEDDEVISAYTNYAGDFALWGVPTGTYEVVLTPVDENSKYKVTKISNIQVINGQTTVIQSIL